jgi:hypothetical protein
MLNHDQLVGQAGLCLIVISSPRLQRRSLRSPTLETGMTFALESMAFSGKPVFDCLAKEGFGRRSYFISA